MCIGQRNHVLVVLKVGRIHSPPQGVTILRCGLSSEYFDNMLLWVMKIFVRLHLFTWRHHHRQHDDQHDRVSV